MSLKLPIACAALLMWLFVADQTRAQSALDGFDPIVNGIAIQVVVVQPDGKILIGGDFTSVLGVARNNIARLNPDGTLDAAFDPNANFTVYSIAVQADGKILAAGRFNNIGGQTRYRVARLDATTGLADSFDPDPDNTVYAIAVQSDGKILAAGDFTSIGGQTRNHIARLDAATGKADSFDPDANSNVYAIAIQADGKVLVGGPFHGNNSIGGKTRNYIARLDATTGLADSFDPNANDQAAAIAVQADGKILVGGGFTSIGGQTRNHIARLDATTGAADSFDANANNSVLAIAVQADGKILAGGSFNGANSIGGQMRNFIARLDPMTGLADSFDPNTNDFVLSIAVQADGKILAGGYFGFLAPNGTKATTRNRIARLETDGRLDQTIGDVVPGAYSVIASAVQPDGKILIGGGFTTVLGATRNGIARLNTDGTLDPAFDPNATGLNNFPYVTSIAVQADGKILVGGYFNSIGGHPRNNIARLDPTTGQADSFNPDATGTNASVRPIVVQGDGKILVGGTFTSIGGQPRNNIARLDSATGMADSFDPNSGGTNGGEVESIAVQADGKLLVGGYFMTIGEQPRNHIARLDATTGLADSFDPNASGPVYSLAIQPDGKILAGGGFSTVGGQARHNIARLDAITGLADSFNPSADFTVVFAIALQEDGKILAGGDFNSIGGQPRTRFARLDPASGAVDSFDSKTAGTVNSIALQADGKILIGGSLYTVGGQTRGSFARLSNDTAALQNLAVNPKTITWTRSGSSPHLARATFEYSTDNANYTPLGHGIPQSGSSTWTLPGLNLPIGKNFYIRARGFYRSGISSGSESITESVRNAFLSPTFGNISSRGRGETGDNTMIGGFIITGTQPKTIIVRGIGPSLSVPGALADPVIEVHGSSGELLASNDNWRDDPNQQHVIDSGLAPSNDLESALWGIINPGSYTVVLRGKNNTTGIGVFEAYDLDQTADSQLANVSTRGFVQTGDDVLIGGVIVLGQDSRRVILRAIGPSLSVAGRLGDPTLELHDGNGALVVANDNWRSDQEAEIIATTVPPSNDLESAIVRNLTPGNYTAIVRGVNGATGIAVVEAYGLD